MRHLVAIAVALVVFCTASLAAERTLNIVATEFPPYYGKDLENNGFFTEIVREAFKRSGYDVEIKFLPWKRAMQGTVSGRYDGLYSVWRRPEREEWSVFSDDLPANELGFYKRKSDKISFDSLDDLKSYTIGLVRGYAVPPGFDEAGLKTFLGDNDEMNLRKLYRGRVDLVLIDRIMAQYIIDKKLPEAASELEWLDPAIHVDTQHLVISKKTPDHDAILADFNKGLATMKADGTMKEIMARHGF
jgi:polar amino acid transport system substrate-binding protein